jgi:hypothetical protein
MTAAALTRGHKAYGLRTVTRMEWRKLLSIRSTGWTLAVFAAGMIGIAILIGTNAPVHFVAAADRAAWDPTETGFAGLAIGQLVIGILGVLTISSEFSSGMIRATFAAVPRRPLVLAAKAAVLTVVTLAAGEILAFAAFAAAEASLPAVTPHASLSQPGVVRAVLLAGVYPCLIGLIGLGLGALIRHTAGAICAVVGVVFVLPLVLLPLGADNTQVERLLPEQIAENSLTAVKPVSGALSPGLGFAVLCLYAAAALAAGAWALARRDA